MSRRPNPAADRAAQNQQTLKSLVKLESNKSCADCKRNKHPRWASWNLGVFVCIRCSGIHRGMGTHISRVKSVDLDSWTDEQLQSMLKWGNSRANKYWEAKLAEGHVPSEAKMENFIRTKYESKRWVMDGGIPDPSTLGSEGDDDVPLNVVQEKAKLERSASQRAASTSSQPIRPPQRSAQNMDLFGDDPISAPPRPSTTGPTPSRPPPPPKADPAPPKATKQGDSLLGLDFFGGGPTDPPSRPASNPATPSTTSVPSRPDLKQSILSLYSIPKPQPPQQNQHLRQDSFGGVQSPNQGQASNQGGQGLSDAFGGLSFSSPAPQQPPKPSAFADLTSFQSKRSPPAPTPSFGGGGSFFDTTPKSPPTIKPSAPQAPKSSASSDLLGDFSGFKSTNTIATSAPPKQTMTGNSMGDLFDLSSPAPAPMSQNPPPAQTSISSAFNLSSPSAPAQTSTKPQTSNASGYSSGISSADAWGTTEAWGSVTSPSTKAASSTHVRASSNDFGGWASSTTQPKVTSPKVSQDEDFGGWSSATYNQPQVPKANPQPAKPLGGMGGDDLFSNVWE